MQQCTRQQLIYFACKHLCATKALIIHEPKSYSNTKSKVRAVVTLSTDGYAMKTLGLFLLGNWKLLETEE